MQFFSYHQRRTKRNEKYKPHVKKKAALKAKEAHVRNLAKDAAEKLGFVFYAESRAHRNSPLYSYVSVEKKARIFSADSDGFEINLKKLMKGKGPDATKEQKAFTKEFETLYSETLKPKRCDKNINTFDQFVFN